MQHMEWLIAVKFDDMDQLNYDHQDSVHIGYYKTHDTAGLN